MTERVTILEKPKDQFWTRADSHLVVEHLGCHVERWSKIPYRMVAHIVDVRRERFASFLGHDNFTVLVVPQCDMWKEEK